MRIRGARQCEKARRRHGDGPAARHQLDSVKPRFQKEAHTIREAFIAELGAPPRFKFTVHDWTGNGGPRPGKSAAAAAPGTSLIR